MAALYCQGNSLKQSLAEVYALYWVLCSLKRVGFHGRTRTAYLYR